MLIDDKDLQVYSKCPKMHVTNPDGRHFLTKLCMVMHLGPSHLISR